jgi:general secretion pathway protein B
VSFILDALKKAESERHRASGPVLVDVRLAPHRRGLPVWGWILGGVLLANLAVLAWLMLHKPAAHEAAAANGAATAPVAAAAEAVRTAPATPPALPPATNSAATAAPAAAPPPAPAAASVDYDNLPTVQDVLAQGVSLPPLLLNLHVYDATPALRFVMLNGLRLGEGEYMPDGIKVVAITKHGVVLDARGRRFLLPAGG